MFKCWETEPSDRPSFTQLKDDTFSLLQSSAGSTRFIRFPWPEDIYDSETCTYITTTNEQNSAQEQRPSRERNPTPQRYTPSPSPSDGAPLLDSINEHVSLELPASQPLDTETRRRRHLSAPISHPRDGELDNSSVEIVRRRTLTNAYASTPRHDQRLQVRESFEWNLEPPDQAFALTPVITIHDASNGSDEED